MDKKIAEKEPECKKCTFWRDYGIPIIVTLVALQIVSLIHLQNCQTQVCNRAIPAVYLDGKNVSELFSKDRYQTFCNAKGFDGGGYQYVCDYIGCYSIKDVDGNKVSATRCYTFQEVFAFGKG